MIPINFISKEKKSHDCLKQDIKCLSNSIFSGSIKKIQPNKYIKKACNLNYNKNIFHLKALIKLK